MDQAAAQAREPAPLVQGLEMLEPVPVQGPVQVQERLPPGTASPTRMAQLT